MSFTHIRVRTETRDKLLRLRGILNVKSIDNVIEEMTARLGYSNAFFDRIERMTKKEDRKE